MSGFKVPHRLENMCANFLQFISKWKEKQTYIYYTVAITLEKIKIARKMNPYI